MKIGKRIFGTAVLPMIAVIVALIMSLAGHINLFDSQETWLVFVRAVVSTTIVTFALSINLSSGRFDFSLGAISLLSSVISLEIATKCNLGAFPTILLSIVMGAFLGIISGGIYCITNLPPIIASLGVTLLYEGIAYVITSGHGVSIVVYDSLMNFQNIWNFIIIGVIVLALIIVVFDYTKFGYDYNSLITGQEISVDIGIREKLNALICYGISGALMGLYGFINATTNGVVQMSLNFGSISPMFLAFLPMFIGGFVGRYSNDKLGYLLGGFISGIISVIYIRFNVSSSIQQIVSAMILVLFLIYLNNEGTLKKIFSFIHFKKNKKPEEIKPENE